MTEARSCSTCGWCYSRMTCDKRSYNVCHAVAPVVLSQDDAAATWPVLSPEDMEEACALWTAAEEDETAGQEPGPAIRIVGGPTYTCTQTDQGQCIECLVCGCQSYHPDDVRDKICPVCDETHTSLERKLVIREVSLR